MYTTLLAEGKFYAAFLDIDVDLAASARAAGCRCGGALHSANYPRKPRGGPGHLGADYDYRLSLCCATDGCRKRVTPPSVRFLGRKVYLAAVVVLVSAMRQGPTPTRVAKLHDLLGVGERTLRPWRTWGPQIFSQLLVMAHGRIVESGTHAALLAQQGQYARMYELHRRKFLGTVSEWTGLRDSR